METSVSVENPKSSQVVNSNIEMIFEDGRSTTYGVENGGDELIFMWGSATM